MPAGRVLVHVYSPLMMVGDAACEIGSADSDVRVPSIVKDAPNTDKTTAAPENSAPAALAEVCRSAGLRYVQVRHQSWSAKGVKGSSICRSV